MNNLTAQQIAVINAPAAMKIITEEAKKAIATKNNTTIGNVEIALNLGNEKVLKMFAELVSLGINEAAKLA